MVAEAVVAKLGRVPSRMVSEQTEEPMAESSHPTNAMVLQPMLLVPIDPSFDRETKPDTSDCYAGCIIKDLSSSAHSSVVQGHIEVLLDSGVIT